MNERTKQVGEGKQPACHLRLLYALLTTSFLVVSEQPGLAVDFRVDGFSKTTIFPGAFTGKTNTPPHFDNTDFSIVVHSCTQWLARLHIQGFSWSPPPDYLEIGCDGTDVYEYSLCESSSRQQAAKTGRTPLNSGIAFAHPGTLGNSRICEEATILWWAFQSGGLLGDREHAGSKSLPLFLTGDDRLRYVPIEQPSYWSRRREPPFVPERIDQVNEGWDYYWPDWDNGPMVMAPLKSAYQGAAAEGFTNVVYRVDKTTTVGGLLLPVEFHLELYQPQMRPSEDGSLGCFLYKYYAFTVTNISLDVAIDSFKPKVIGITSVADRRLITDKRRVWLVNYFETNGWLPRSAIKALPEYAYALRYEAGAAQRLTGPRPPVSYASKSFFWVSFLGLSVICLWLVLGRRHGRANKATNKTTTERN